MARLKLRKLSGNTQKNLDVIEKGSFFGEMAILEAEPRSASAIAVGDVQVLKFDRTNFASMIKTQSQLALRLLVIFAQRIYDANRKLNILLLDDPHLKVSDVFVMLSEKDPGYGKVARMVFHVTVGDVASWCGLPTPESARSFQSPCQER